MQNNTSVRRTGVTLMELLLVVAVLAVVTGIAYPSMYPAMEGRNDIAVLHQILTSISHARAMGIMGRDAEAQFDMQSSAFNYDGKNLLTQGYYLSNMLVDSDSVEAMNVKFNFGGRLFIDGDYRDQARFALKRTGFSDVIGTITLLPVGLPIIDGGSTDNPSSSNPSTSTNFRTIIRRIFGSFVTRLRFVFQ